MKWTRKTAEFQYAPYISEDGRFTVGDLNDNKGLIPEYDELKEHNWDSNETHKAYMTYCKENKIRINGANWILKDGSEVVGIYKSVKEAKQVAEQRAES